MIRNALPGLAEVTTPPDPLVAASTPTEGPPSSPTNEFEAFYRMHRADLVAHLRRMGARPEEAAEAVQDAMLMLLQHWTEVLKPYAWAKRVAWHNVINHRRRDRRWGDGYVPLEDELVDKAPSAERVIETNQLMNLALHQLSYRERQAILLIAFGYTGTEVADLLDITPATVRSMLRRARTKIRSALVDRKFDDER